MANETKEQKYAKRYEQFIEGHKNKSVKNLILIYGKLKENSGINLMLGYSEQYNTNNHHAKGILNLIIEKLEK